MGHMESYGAESHGYLRNTKTCSEWELSLFKRTDQEGDQEKERAGSSHGNTGSLLRTAG